MTGIYSDTALLLPRAWLVWLATGELRLAVFRLQGLHAVLRVLHVGGAAAFFGTVLLLDLRLMGIMGREIALQAMTRMALPVLHVSFAVTLASGAMLFLYDPIQAGSHSYFLPKLLLIMAAVANAALFSLPDGFGLKRIGAGALTRHARIAGAMSLVLWAGVIVAASANHEERPMARSRNLPRHALTRQ